MREHRTNLTLNSFYVHLEKGDASKLGKTVDGTKLLIAFHGTSLFTTSDEQRKKIKDIAREAGVEYREG